jgi:hypothetical protein
MYQLTEILQQLLVPFQSAFARPEVFRTFQLVVFGWILCRQPRRITEIWGAIEYVGHVHINTPCRFFSAARWDWDTLGITLAQLIVALSPFDDLIEIVVDDTLCHKRGDKVAFGSMQRDPVLSSKQRKVIRFAVNYVVLSIVVTVPGRKDRVFSLPILWRVWKPKDLKRIPIHFTKPMLAAEMVNVLANAFEYKRFQLIADQAYINKATLQNHPKNVEVIGPILGNSALYAPPEPRAEGQTGRPALRGERLPTPQELFQDTRKFDQVKLSWKQKRKRVRVHRSEPLLWSGSGQELVRVFSVHDPKHVWKNTALLVTDLTLSASRAMEIYSDRFSIEFTFRDVKQYLGFEDPQVRVEKSVERAHPMAFFVYTLSWLWYMSEPEGKKLTIRYRPWYWWKKTPTFADVLMNFRKECLEKQLFDEYEATPDKRKFIAKIAERMAIVA